MNVNSLRFGAITKQDFIEKVDVKSILEYTAEGGKGFIIVSKKPEKVDKRAERPYYDCYSLEGETIQYGEKGELPIGTGIALLRVCFPKVKLGKLEKDVNQNYTYIGQIADSTMKFLKECDERKFHHFNFTG